MKSRIIPLALAALLAAPIGLSAQEAEEGMERGQLLQVSTWEVAPEEVGAFESAVAKVAEAAKMSNLGYNYRWAFWSNAHRYTLVYPIPNFAYLDEPDQFMRAFEGTEGEAMMKEAFSEFGDIAITMAIDEIAEVKEGWSYAVEGFDWDALSAAHVDEIWPKPNMDEEFNALNKSFKELFENLAYPYPYDAHTVHFGDTGRIVYVTFIDDLSKYYGENNLMAMIEAANMQEAWAAIDEQFNAVTLRWEHYNLMFRDDMTYWPEPEQQAAR